MSITTIYLVRHGATSANLENPHRLQGQRLDLPLDEHGRDQASRAAKALASIPITAVYASPLLRARQTAAFFAEPRGLVERIVPEIIEVEIGRWESLTWDEARRETPEWHDRFHANPGTVPYPEGESFQDVQDRVTPAFAAIAAAHPGEPVVAIGHNVTCRSYLAGLLGIPIDRARAIRQSNGGINVIQYENGKPLVVTVNAAFHL